MAPRKFEPVDVEDVLSKLTLNEKTRLLAGASWVGGFSTRVVSEVMLTGSRAHVLLGPTVNIQRSPLGGRGFEAYSEDPLLSGLTARAFIKGVQSEGVAATIKHYVCNDSEFERTSMSSEVSTRALREIYLRPFELACRNVESPAWAIMAGYNRVNGLHASENEFLLDTVLRKEWAWDGMVMSDWYGTYSADASIKAGLDLEMPGPPMWRADALQRCVVAQKVRVQEIDARVRQVLKFINKVAASGVPENAEETGEPTEEVVALLRESAGSANVLLKNNINLLPLSPSLKSIAVIGPNADAPVYSGGGSANLRPYTHATTLEGIRAALPESVKLQHVAGVLAHKETPLLGHKQLRTRHGKPGFDIDWFHEDPLKNPKAERVHHSIGTNSTCWFVDNLPDNLSLSCWATISGTYTPKVSGKYEFGAMADGLIDMYVNGVKIIDNSTNPVPGPGFFGTASREVLGSITLEARKPAEILLQYASSPIAHAQGYTRTNLDAIPEIRGSCRFGGGRVFTEDEGIQEAVDTAKQADAVVLVRDEDAPSYLNFPGQNGKVFYSEGVFVGYRHYQAYKKDVLFPFGYGLSYTQFEYSNISLSGKIGADSVVIATVTVKNVGKYAGREVVQIYVQDLVSRLDRPIKELKGYSKTSLIQPGETGTVEIALDRYAFAYFDEWAGDGRDGKGKWVAEAGEFEVIVAASSVDERARVKISLEKSFDWM
ncbi:hypothetical protein FRC06_002549 [Ceratobasidium sp. 370]|nr:hypothetical protein FRC06_002549 [Ceratobasidium sp. 370]